MMRKNKQRLRSHRAAFWRAQEVGEEGTGFLEEGKSSLRFSSPCPPLYVEDKDTSEQERLKLKEEHDRQDQALGKGRTQDPGQRS